MTVALVVLALVVSVTAGGRRYRHAQRAQERHEGPYTDDERDQLDAMRRRMRLVCWCILPIAAVMVVVAVRSGGAARVFLLIFSVIPGVVSVYLLVLLAVKQRRGTLPGQG